MFFILCTNLLRMRIIVQIIITVAQSQSALVHMNDIHHTIRIVRRDIHSKITTKTAPPHFCNQLNQTVSRCSGNLFQFRANRSHSVGIQFHAIHCQIIKIAYLLGNSSFLRFLRSQTFNQSLQLFAVIFRQ